MKPIRLERLLVVLIIVLVGILIVEWAFIRQERITVDSRNTAESIYMTNTAVNNFMIMYVCEAICDATGYRVGCNNMIGCPRAWTKTPSPTPKGTPTLTADQITATAVQSKVSAIERIQAACATLRAYDNATLCPDYWLTEQSHTLTPKH